MANRVAPLRQYTRHADGHRSGNLGVGTYSGTVSVTVGSYMAASILVTATVSPPTTPAISANPSSVTFTASAGSTRRLQRPSR